MIGNCIIYLLKEDELKELMEVLPDTAKDIVEDLFGEVVIDNKRYRIVTSDFDAIYGDDLHDKLSVFLENKVDESIIKRFAKEIRRRKAGKIVLHLLITAECAC